jgi:uncharacterized damage-inducible protein DinB
MSAKPASNEYAEYYGRYIGLVPSGNIVDTLGQQMTDTLNLLAGVSEQQALHRYSPEKWSIKEVVGHIIDCERIFAYRALRLARNDNTPLSGFEQDDYVINGGFDQRQLSDLAHEYKHVREASIDLFKGLSQEAWDRRGKANEVEVSVRAIAWIIGGHELHHKGVIRSKYL